MKIINLLNSPPILQKYFGNDYISKVKDISVSEIGPGNIFFNLSNIIGTWRKVRKDGVDKIVKSIQLNGVLAHNFWMIEENNSEDNLAHHYRAIDCNHRLVAFSQLKIETAKCLVFPHLNDAKYDKIAGIIIIFILKSFRCFKSDA